MDKKYDIIGIANPGQDMIVSLERLPATDERGRMLDYCFQGGGNVATAMAMAGTLGASCSLLGVAGDDIFGEMMKRDLEYNHVDTSHLLVDPGTRSDFCICVAERSTGGKNILSKPGTRRDIEVSDLDPDYIRSAKFLHVGIMTPAVLKASELLRGAGGKVSIDAAYYRPDIYNNYGSIDIFIASEYYFDSMRADIGASLSCLEIMRYIRARGPETVIFTFGERGCEGLAGDRHFTLPAHSVPVVDTTGAGDVFHGAFLFAALQGRDPVECAKFATGASAIKCTRPGGRAGIADLAALEAYLATGIIDNAALDRRLEYYRSGR